MWTWIDKKGEKTLKTRTQKSFVFVVSEAQQKNSCGRIFFCKTLEVIILSNKAFNDLSFLSKYD